MSSDIAYEVVPVGITLSAQGKRTASSRWLLTYNTNNRVGVTPPEKLEQLRAGLTAGLNAAFTQASIVSAIRLKKECIAQGHAVNKQWIKSIRCVPEVEQSGERGQLHGHVYLEIIHFTKLQVDYAAFKRVVKQHLRAATGEPKRKIYFNAKLLRGPATAEVVERYVKKGQTPSASVVT